MKKWVDLLVSLHRQMRHFMTDEQEESLIELIDYLRSQK